MALYLVGPLAGERRVERDDHRIAGCIEAESRKLARQPCIGLDLEQARIGNDASGPGGDCFREEPAEQVGRLGRPQAAFQIGDSGRTVRHEDEIGPGVNQAAVRR